MVRDDTGCWEVGDRERPRGRSSLVSLFVDPELELPLGDRLAHALIAWVVQAAAEVGTARGMTRSRSTAVPSPTTRGSSTTRRSKCTGGGSEVGRAEVRPPRYYVSRPSFGRRSCENFGSCRRASAAHRPGVRMNLRLTGDATASSPPFSPNIPGSSSPSARRGGRRRAGSRCAKCRASLRGPA